MDLAAALDFADYWAQGWNAHDIEQVLSPFAQDTVFTSPIGVQLLDGSGGAIRGHGTYLSGDADPAGATAG